jgi:alpha-tubulin suppressor-like RCC1 family protein
MSTLHRHTCVATDDGKAWCWGDNTHGQLGDGTNSPGLHPVLVRGLPGPVAKVFAGYGHTCAVLRSGEVTCWGNNQDGQCGVRQSEQVSTPVLIPLPGVQFIQVTPSEKHTCALATDQTVYCWGNTEYGECGDPALTSSRNAAPTKVPELESVVRISAVKNHTCAVRSNPPTLVCWGSNSRLDMAQAPFVNGKLGPAAEDLSYSATPIPVDIGERVIAAELGPEATYAVTEGGNVYAWGSNDGADLGVESEMKIVGTPTPVMVRADTGLLVPLRDAADLISSGGPGTCLWTMNRGAHGASYLCWGTDRWGEVGVGTEEGARATHRYPVAVRALEGTAAWVARGEGHACGGGFIPGSVEIFCYGRPGALGDGSSWSEESDPPSRWQGRPVVWAPVNFAPALE